MSFSELPQCVQDCFKPLSQSLDCANDDLQCLCEKEPDALSGITFGLCVGGGSLGSVFGGTSEGCEDSASAQRDIQSVCSKAGYSTSSGNGGSSSSAISQPSASADTTKPSSASQTSLQSTAASQSPNSAATDDSAVNETASSSSSSGLSAGAAAGIGVGGALIAVLLGLGLFLLWRRKKKQKKDGPDSVDDDEIEAAEASGKPMIDAEAPGSELHHELYGGHTHTSELDSSTNTPNASPPPHTNGLHNTGAVHELPADYQHTTGSMPTKSQ